MNKYFLLTSFLMFSFTFGFAQTIPWERISPKPIESSLEEIVNVPGTERLIAIGSNATIMHSDNMGESWTINYKPADISRFTHLNAIQFVDSNLGFAVGSNATLLKTTDRGLSWSEISIDDQNDFYDVFFINEQTGFVTKPDTIMKTINGGVNWIKTPVIEHTEPNFLHFVSDSIGFCVSNYGTSFYKTQNLGLSWDTIEIFPFIDNFYISAIEFIDENTGFIGGSIYNSSNIDEVILRTNDGGLSWSQVYFDYFNSIISFHFLDSERGFAVGPRVMYDNMILWTDDGGLNWQESNMPSNRWNLKSISFLNSGIGICVGSLGQILKSEDWGVNWSLNYQNEIYPSNINDAQVVDETTVLIGITYLANGGIPSGGIMKSTDSGFTWENKLSTDPITAIHFVNPDFGVGIKDYFGEICVTNNGGETWAILEIDTWNLNSKCVHFINEEVGFVGGEDNNPTIYKTTDGGLNWTKNTLPSQTLFSEIIDITFVDDSNGFAIDNYNDDFYLITNDQGETWTIDTFDIPIFANKIYFISPEIGFVIGYFKILKTIDGGDTWTEVPHGLDGFFQFTDIEFPTEEVGYITVSNNEETILKSIDGGNSWTAIDFECTSTPTTLAFFSEEEGLVMGENGIIFKTFSGGIVGVQEFDELPHNNTDLLCFPNPVKDLLNIDLSIETTTKIIAIEFFDSNATLVNRMFVADNQQLIQVDVSGWKNGVYFIVTTYGGKKYKTTKFIKFN